MTETNSGDDTRCAAERTVETNPEGRLDDVDVGPSVRGSDMGTVSKGWVSCCMRSGRYTYRKVLVHRTNPDHLMPSVGTPAESPRLQITARYAAGRPRR